MEFLSHSVSETEQIAQQFAASLHPGDVVAYSGDLGAGKTAFTRGLARGLGYTGRVTSPTFNIVNEYDGPVPLFHFDLYRLEGEEDLFDIGWEDYLTRGGICAVEWSQRAPGVLPPETIRVSLERHPEESDWRIITIQGGTP